MSDLLKRARAAVPEAAPMNGAAVPCQSYDMAVGPQEACELLAHYHYPKQRPLRENHVRKLVLAMNQNRFRPEALQLCMVGSQGFLVDGQHRLNAVIRAERTYCFPVTEYYYETMAEVDDHYSVVGQPRMRQARELPVVLDFGAEAGLSSTELRHTLAALVLLATGFTAMLKRMAYLGGPPVQDRVDLGREWKKEVMDYWELARASVPAMNRHVRLAPMVAVGMVTLREQPKKAQEFWGEVFSLAGMEPGTGTHHLIAYLMSRSFKAELGPQGARCVARCWNMFYDGETRQVLKPPRLDLPIVIAGTRYDGKEHYPLVKYAGE